MPLYFVTGIAGAGKSELVREFRSRGIEAYDTDDDGFARWRNNETGYIYPKSSVKAEQRTEEFIRSHSWIVPVEKVEELAGRAADKSIFLCGVAYNEHEFWHLCKAIFALVIDDDTLKHRLETRTNNNWGKQPHELELSLEYNHKAKAAYEEAEQIIIDATQPIEIVADEILRIANVNA